MHTAPGPANKTANTQIKYNWLVKTITFNLALEAIKVTLCT